MEVLWRVLAAMKDKVLTLLSLKGVAVEWMYISTPNSYVAILTFKVKQMGHLVTD